MGFRFRKSFKLAPGVRLNLSKKSMGLSFGGKGARFSVNSSGRKTASVGVPGTGVSYSKTFGGPSSKHRRVQTDPDMSYTQDSPDLTPPPPKQPANKKKNHYDLRNRCCGSCRLLYYRCRVRLDGRFT